MNSFKAEVFVHGEWATNALRFATEPEAVAYGQDLANRWLLVADVRSAPSDDPVNYRWESGEAVRLG